MFWIVDNFLMRKKFRKAQTMKDKDSSVKYVAGPGDKVASDDEVVMHSLIDNESCDTIIDDNEALHRREFAR